MYERFYQLRERPFALSPDPDYLYPSRVHQEALSYLRYGVEGHAGFVVITGEIGSGKTTLVQTLLRSLDRETTVARIVNTMLEPRELIEAILLDLNLPTDSSKPAMLRTLAEFLVGERQQGRLVLLVVDEAQNLGTDALEEVRMLSNLETEKSKLIQIVLVGQPDLRDTLERPDLEQLRQRITVSYHLGALDAADTAAYVNHRLRRASTGAPVEFPRDVTDLVHERSRGVPRIINVICDAILLFGYGAEQYDVSLDLAREAVVELEDTGVLAPLLAQHNQPLTPRREASSPAAVTAPTALARADTAGEMSADSARTVASVPVPAPIQARPVAAALSATAAAQAAAERDSALRAREAAMARREEALVEQRRVLAEQLRLLGNEGREVRGGNGSAWPPIAAYPRPADAAHAPTTLTAFSPESPIGRGLWSKVRRMLGAVPEAAFDERS
jgi:general secretion pathway protein A